MPTLQVLIARVDRWCTRFPPLARTFAASPEPRSRRQALCQILLALAWGGMCHALFAAAVLSMAVAMWFGMARSLGSVPQPWAWLANLALIAQFPIGHTLLMTRSGQRLLARLAPADTGRTLATTSYAIVASAQVLALFALWTPSGLVWWQAQGGWWWLANLAYGGSWIILVKATWDAGAEVQSGLLGWVSLLRGVRPQFPPMPTRGLFRLVRQPIYLAFALTTWTVPVWTPDQLLLALGLTAYCALGPIAKERRFARLFGEDWRAYRARIPYFLPLRMRL